MIPNNWRKVKVSDVASVALGKMLDQNKNRGTELLPYLGNQNVQWNKFELGDLKLMRFEPHEIERYSIISGDLVVCEGGQPGRCAIWIGSSIMYQKALLRVRPKSETNSFFLKITLEYLVNIGELENHFTGTTIKHLPAERLNGLEINLPPLEEQVKIAEILTAWDDALETLEKLIAAKLELKRGLMQELLTGKSRFKGFENNNFNKKSLMEISTFAKKTINPLDFSDEVFAHFSIPAFDDYKEPVIEAGRKIQSNKFLIESGCILFSKLNPRINRVWQVKESYSHRMICSTEFISIIPDARFLSSDFLFQILKFPDFIDVLRSKVAAGTKSRERLDPSDVMDFSIFLPPLEEQQRIAQVLTTLDTEIEALQSQLERVKTQKKGLMQQLLTGKVRVKV